MSVAKNVASNTSAMSTAEGDAVAAKTTPASSTAETVDADKAATTANGAAKATNGDTPKTDRGDSNGGVEVAPLETTAKSEPPAPSRKSSLLLNIGGKQSPERGVTDRRSFGAGGPATIDRRASAGGGSSSRGNSPAHAPSGGSGPIGGERARKKSSEWSHEFASCISGETYTASHTPVRHPYGYYTFLITDSRCPRLSLSPFGKFVHSPNS